VLPIPTRTLSDGRSIPVIGFGTHPMTDDSPRPRSRPRSISATGSSTPPRSTATKSASGGHRALGRGPIRHLPHDQVARRRPGSPRNERGPPGFTPAARPRVRGPLLIHWPMPSVNKYVDAWRAMIELREEGLAHSIGVSNFNEAHLDRLLSETGVSPVITRSSCIPPGPKLTCATSMHATTS